MELSTAGYIIPAAFILDLVLGDPTRLPHPIRWFGRAITTGEPLFRNLNLKLTLSGAIFAVSLIAGTWTVTYVLIKTAQHLHPLLKAGVEILIIYYCISIRSLESSAMAVFRALTQTRLDDARAKVALIVGRDVEHLNPEEISRATVETVGENLVDGVISPLFYAAIGGAPLAMAYKMINTLDSMIGYKNDKYRNFGKVAARIDDIANLIPARISILVISAAAKILTGQGARTFQTALTEGANHTSPNAGYSEAAFAGALGIRLGGPNYYHGCLVSKPYLGIPFTQINRNHIKKACDLMMLSALIWMVVLAGLLYLLSFLTS
ncbi:MAG: cobalamin biosynthesis protein CobD [Deltaproteobacteria bacterium]|nr:cobalamin biosynthesis protein CobD [Deltaproteobacteria bacterium]